MAPCSATRIESSTALQRKPGTGGGLGKVITAGSTEEQMVSDHFKSGVGLDTSFKLVNEDREQNGLSEVGRSAVYTARQRLGLRGFPPNRKDNRSGKRAKKTPRGEVTLADCAVHMDVAEAEVGLDGAQLEIPQGSHFDEVRV